MDVHPENVISRGVSFIASLRYDDINLTLVKQGSEIMQWQKKTMFLTILIFASSVFDVGAAPDQKQSWDARIPMMNGAFEAESQDISQLSTKTISYRIQTSSVESVFDFYNEHFSGNGWNDPFKDASSFQKQFGGNWSGYNFRFGLNGEPLATYARVWKAPTIPLVANATFEATRFDGRLFYGKITVTVSPEVDLSPLMAFQRELTQRPEAIFILSEQVGGNPFDLAQANINERPDLDEADPIVVSYFETIDEILEGYRLFREEHLVK